MNKKMAELFAPTFEDRESSVRRKCFGLLKPKTATGE